MPCIQTTTNVKITQEQEQAMKTQLGGAIALIPGKSESWLMLTFDDERAVYFKGDRAPAAFVCVQIFGKAEKSAYDLLTVRITDIISVSLGIPPDRIYVKYEETAVWGWNGINF